MKEQLACRSVAITLQQQCFDFALTSQPNRCCQKKTRMTSIEVSEYNCAIARIKSSASVQLSKCIVLLSKRGACSIFIGGGTLVIRLTPFPRIPQVITVIPLRGTAPSTSCARISPHHYLASGCTGYGVAECWRGRKCAAKDTLTPLLRGKSPSFYD